MTDDNVTILERLRGVPANEAPPDGTDPNAVKPKAAIASRLPRDAVIDFAGVLNKPPRLYIGMTITTQEHLDALMEALPIFKGLLEIGTPSDEPKTE